jgi:hypothetical protein
MCHGHENLQEWELSQKHNKKKNHKNVSLNLTQDWKHKYAGKNTIYVKR